MLDPVTIHVWSQLRDLFRSNFQGTFIEPVTTDSLLTIRQGPVKTLRDYFRRFSQTKAQIRGISDSSVIDAATQGLAEGPLYDRLNRRLIRTVEVLMSKFEEYAWAEEKKPHRRRSQASEASHANSERLHS